MFKYVWIIIVVGAYLLWGWSTVKDIIETMRKDDYDSVFELLENLENVSSMAFIFCTVIILGSVSFIVWLVSFFAE